LRKIFRLKIVEDAIKECSFTMVINSEPVFWNVLSEARIFDSFNPDLRQCEFRPGRDLEARHISVLQDLLLIVENCLEKGKLALLLSWKEQLLKTMNKEI